VQLRASLPRRQLLALPAILQLASLAAPAAAPAAAPPPVSRELLQAFADAMAAQGDCDKMEAAWSRAISLAPDNAAAWSNRGTARLQAGRCAARSAAPSCALLPCQLLLWGGWVGPLVTPLPLTLAPPPPAAGAPRPTTCSAPRSWRRPSAAVR
jgi:hypothetical protein